MNNDGAITNIGGSVGHHRDEVVDIAINSISDGSMLHARLAKCLLGGEVGAIDHAMLST